LKEPIRDVDDLSSSCLVPSVDRSELYEKSFMGCLTLKASTSKSTPWVVVACMEMEATRTFHVGNVTGLDLQSDLPNILNHPNWLTPILGDSRNYREIIQCFC